MPRVNRGVAPHKGHKRVLKDAEGYWGPRSRIIRTARDAVEKGWKYAFRDRRQRKREFRSLWIVRINAAAREHGLSYSRLIHGLAAAGVDVDRKNLAAVAVDDPKGLGDLAKLAK